MNIDLIGMKLIFNNKGHVPRGKTGSILIVFFTSNDNLLILDSFNLFKNYTSVRTTTVSLPLGQFNFMPSNQFVNY